MKIAEKCRVAAVGLSLAAAVAFCPLAFAATPEEVEAQINQIGAVTLDSATAIANAQGAYASLPAAQQQMVFNVGTLAAAQQTLEDLQVNALIEKLNAQLYKEHDEVENVDFYFWKGFPATDQTTFILPYFCAVGGDLQPIRLLYDYYGKNWIFYDQIIYNVDGETYRRAVSKDKIIQKTVIDSLGSGAYVWEYGDDIAEPSEIEILKKACTAKKATFRFKGNGTLLDYHMDSYQNDRVAITRVFDAYESLQAASPTVRARALAGMKTNQQGTKFVRLAF